MYWTVGVDFVYLAGGDGGVDNGDVLDGDLITESSMFAIYKLVSM